MDLIIIIIFTYSYIFCCKQGSRTEGLSLSSHNTICVHMGLPKIIPVGFLCNWVYSRDSLHIHCDQDDALTGPK